MGGASRGEELGNAVTARCIELAGEALEAGDDPFGSVLVAADGKVLFEDRNRVSVRPPEGSLRRRLTDRERDI